MVRPLARVVTMAAIVAVAVCTITAGAAADTRPNVVARVTDAAPGGPTVVAIGDSIMEGHGLNPSEAWPALLAVRDGWDLTNLASDGSGFVTQGDAGDTFADQARAAIALDPEVVIVSGSSNDLGVPDAALTAATGSTIEELRDALPHATILAVSPVWSDTAAPAQLTDIADQVREAARAAHGTILNIGQPLLDRSDLMQGDDVHPTAEGQQDLANAVQRALNASGVAF